MSALKELPPCNGPKLKRFPHHQSPITWLERLDDDRDEDEVGQGYVFRARIKSREYAVKVFRFFDPNDQEYIWKARMGEDTTAEQAAYYTDPFFAECRAYGSIHENKKKGKYKTAVALTVPCHGFLLLQERDQLILEERGVDLGLDEVDVDVQRTIKGGLRARAIVKDVAPEHSGVTGATAKGILRGLRSMKKMKIYNGDIRLDNFKGARLVDFGSSYTEPHAILDGMPARGADGIRHSDLMQFDEMINEEGIKGVRAMPNLEVIRSLRPRKRLR